MSNERIDLEWLLEEDGLMQDLNWSIARFEQVEKLVKEMTAELKRCYDLIDTFYPPPGMDMWGEDPNHPRHEWEEEVVAGNVNTGYWHWVSNQKRYLTYK